MAEKINEKIDKNRFDNEKLGEIAEKQTEVIRNRLDLAEKEHLEKQDVHEALNQATELAKETTQTSGDARASSERHLGAPSRKRLNQSYKSQIKNVQSELGPGSKLVSKIIHLPFIEKTSDFLGSTLARPKALLYGSVTAFVTITVLYILARYFGYRLSGFETIGAFIIGWLIGTVVDYLSSRFKNE